MSFEVLRYGQPDADTLLFQMVDDHDLEVIEQEVSCIRELSGGQDFCLTAVKVNDWNKDLSPWPAPAVFGNEDFGDGAAETLKFLLNEVVPGADISETSKRRLFVGGYSLAGLFALWAGYQTERFDGIAAALPSIWFPRFTEYMRENRIRADAVYLSLGDREERTKNPVMAQVGNAVRDAETILREGDTDCILEWNKGNHFKEPDLRTAKAFAWLMNRRIIKKRCCHHEHDGIYYSPVYTHCDNPAILKAAERTRGMVLLCQSPCSHPCKQKAHANLLDHLLFHQIYMRISRSSVQSK